MKHFTGTRTACERKQTIESKSHMHPTRGHHVGKPPHVDLDKSDPSKGGDGVGWTLHEHDVRKHPDKDLYAYPCESDISAAAVSLAEKAEWDSAKAAAVELPKEWDTAADVAPKPVEEPIGELIR